MLVHRGCGKLLITLYIRTDEETENGVGLSG